MCVCVCVCVCVFFGRVKPELGVIPSGQIKHSTVNIKIFLVFLIHIKNTLQDGNKFIIFFLTIRSEEFLLTFFRAFDLYEKHITGWK